MSFEAQILTSDSLRVEILPELGAKISSLRTLKDGEEFLQQPLRPYAARTRTMAFEDGDASGVDECVPTVSGCEIECSAGTLAVPDHGDFWRVPFTARRDGDELALEATGFSLPLRFEKRLRLEGDRLIFLYRLENIGSGSVPFLWSAHPGFAAEEGDEIVLPPSVPEIAVWHSGNRRLGAAGRVHSWPHTYDPDGKRLDLSRTGAAADGVGDKIFANAPPEGWVALHRRRLGCRVEVRFDPGKTPFLGLWLAYGGWPTGGGRRQHCVALEPCTAPVDSLAVAMERRQARKLSAGSTWEWKIEVAVIPS